MKTGIMTRMVVLMVIITVLIIISGLFAHQLLRHHSGQLERNIEAVQNDIGAEKWDSAAEVLDRIKNDWESIKKTWSVLIDHEEIDSIDVTITRLEALLDAKDSASALSEAAALRRLVTHIPEREKLSLENLF
ncbi:MAG TPA: DUF4363 family protein [Clostridiales bacterium]|nr:DUF4363 family protein [Clostridiales bacterium]HPV01159.1 DUF4363 family protein [Clostridiales bacterium]